MEKSELTLEFVVFCTRVCNIFIELQPTRAPCTNNTTKIDLYFNIIHA